MTTMMFYENTTILQRDRHRSLKLDTSKQNYLFAAKTNAVLLAGSEFPDAVRDHPIVFVGQEGGPFTSAALVGLRDQENLMVGAAGEWESGAYVPAFVRRYPFVLAEGETAESMTVCIDEACPMLTGEQGLPLFGSDGVETPFLTNMVGFLRLFHAEMTRTAEFAARLAALGLLIPKAVQVQDKDKQTLEGLWVVDEEKLRALSDSQTLQLVRSGDMALIHAHLLSLPNVKRLVRRLEERRTAA